MAAQMATRYPVKTDPDYKAFLDWHAGATSRLQPGESLAPPTKPGFFEHWKRIRGKNPDSRRNLFGWLTTKKTTYHRDVKAERAALKRQAKQHAADMRGHAVDIQEDYAYNNGVRDGKAGRRARYGEFVTAAATKHLGRVKAHALTRRFYGLGYRSAVEGRNPAARSEDLYARIRPGMRVSILDRFGKVSTGRVVMSGPAGWVLNMGGRHGTPAIASPQNVVRVTGSAKPGLARLSGSNPSKYLDHNTDLFTRLSNEKEPFSGRVMGRPIGGIVRVSRGAPVEILQRAESGRRLLIKADNYGRPAYGWVDSGSLTGTASNPAGRNPSPGYKAYAADVLLKMLDAPAQQVGAAEKRKAAAELARRGKLPASIAAFYKGKRNPLAAAARLSERFHGRPATTVERVVDRMSEHRNLTKLGDLIRIVIDTPTGLVATLNFKQSPASEVVKLAASEDGKQMYFRGGDQEINLKVLGMDSPQWIRDKIELGRLHEFPDKNPDGTPNEEGSIVYRTKKVFNNFRLTDWWHKTGEVTGKKVGAGARPLLVYDHRNKLLELVGGNYVVRRAGIIN